MTLESILTGTGVSKHFGALRALDDVNFELRRGEILGIIGPNGAGKTTLLSVINGTLPITRGKIFSKRKRLPVSNPFGSPSSGYREPSRSSSPFRG